VTCSSASAPISSRCTSTCGQTVEILTQKNAAPSRDWLSPHQGYLRTAKARNRVRQWFKQQDHARYVSEGKTLLDKELARLGVEEKPQLDQLARRYNFHKGEDLLAAIGRGEVALGQVARHVGEPKGERRAEQPEIRPRPPTPARSKGKGQSEVIVEGIGDLMTHMAHCCKPVPNDPIIGYVTRGRGVTVHRRDCTNVRKMPPEEQQRLVEVRWAEQPADATYPVDIFVVAADRKGLLRDVSGVFSDEDVDVLGVHTVSDRTTDRAVMRFTVEVKDMTQLEQVVNKLVQVPDVLNVRRPH
jgi:GTP pyrophosphokinase